MSDDLERRAAQGYRRNPGTCATCKHVVEVRMHYTNQWGVRALGVSPSGASFVGARMCGIGDFLISVDGVCDLWESAE